MNNKINIYNLIIILPLILMTIGCEDFLDVEPQGKLTQENFPVTPADALLATNACYTTFRDWNYHSGGYPILDIMSDDALKGSNPSDQLATIGPYNTFTITPTQDGLDRWWTQLYVGIKRANVVIEKVPDIDMDSDLRTRYIAEARFIRGLMYFDMVRAWGGVPIVTSTNPELNLPRSSAEEVYNLLLADLEFAANNLPVKSSYDPIDVGRATRGAANALLARVYLFRGDFENAETHALAVISTNEYALENDFIDANGVNGNNGVESIFEIGALEVGSTSGGGNQYANTQGVRGNPNRGWGFNRPSLDLRNSFESGDPRLEGTIIDLGDVLDGVEIMGDATTPDETFENGVLVEIECYNRKVWVPGINTTTQWGHHRRLIRYADVLLMAAEALNENNKSSDALVYLNLVRERARGGNNAILPDITTTDQSELRNIILEERRHELAMEGHRYWDLVRTGKAQTVLGPLGFETGKHELLPIPQTEIDISQGNLTQNPNW
ncbi:MAG TPA: RagB/SusD family nutrient uptake outer membrane protein [Bacteroidales bacterium]|nr:RagB/SusD family nutrient uptake outer membrane protein [Bacteroidales bacterium]HPE55334.1 RagB/SusD family nutrient uptake outer membrane protein [Bacteroidales bacterium]HRX95940.1 RagB/SusD family nutrient uptake outer membrane protein [Bacteroidales bacterium]